MQQLLPSRNSWEQSEFKRILPKQQFFIQGKTGTYTISSEKEQKQNKPGPKSEHFQRKNGQINQQSGILLILWEGLFPNSQIIKPSERRNLISCNTKGHFPRCCNSKKKRNNLDYGSDSTAEEGINVIISDGESSIGYLKTLNLETQQTNIHFQRGKIYPLLYISNQTPNYLHRKVSTL